MLMTWSSRERNRSCSPLSRRSRGRIEPLRSRSGVQNHGFGFEGIPNFKLQENPRRSPNFRQIQSRGFPKFLLPVNRFGIFHGRPLIDLFKFAEPALISARATSTRHLNFSESFSD